MLFLYMIPLFLLMTSAASAPLLDRFKKKEAPAKPAPVTEGHERYLIVSGFCYI